MNIILLSFLLLCIVVSPLTASATPMGDKILKLMEQKSKMPETIQNAADYWCLHNYLNTFTYAPKYLHFSSQDIPEEKILSDIDMIYEKYTDEKNYLLYPEGRYDYTSQLVSDAPTLEVHHYSENLIYLIINGHNPLKMSKAQEILTTHNNTVIETPIFPEHTNDVFFDTSCDKIKENLGIKIAGTKHSHLMYQQFVNLREEVVTVRTIHVDTLMDRGYLLYKPGVCGGDYCFKTFASMRD